MPPETVKLKSIFFHLSKLPVSGGIKKSLLSPPETGNFFYQLLKIPVSGDIKELLSMPPETGNFLHLITQPLNDGEFSPAKSPFNATQNGDLSILIKKITPSLMQ